MKNNFIDIKDEALHRFILPLIVWIEECQNVLDNHQCWNFNIPVKNQYLQTFLASHMFEMIGKIYIAINELENHNQESDMPTIVNLLKDKMKENGHELDVLYSNKMREYFWIEKIEHVKSEIVKFGNDDIQFDANYYKIDFIWITINICHTENARYGIFAKKSPEIFWSCQSDVNLKLGMMVSQLREFSNKNMSNELN